MSANKIKFLGDGADYQTKLADSGHDAAIVHLEGATAADYTLCGLTLDGDPDTCGKWKLVRSKVSCPECVAIIKHCRSVKV